MFNLKLALRALFRTPFVTVVAILSLGLGIGANAAIFSLFNQMILRPLPVPDPGRLVNLGAPGVKSGMTSCGNAGSCDVIFSYPMFRDLEKQQSSFTGIAAHREFGANLSYKGETLKGGGLEVSGSYFSVLGLTPARGRLIDANDDRVPGESSVAVLSHRYWRTRFASDPGVVGEKMVVNGVPMTIIGVGPEGFDGTTIGDHPSVFVPITMTELMQPGRNKVLDNRRAYWVYLFARLKPRGTIDQAQAAINQPYHAIINEVDVPLQKGMSATRLEQFKQKVMTVDPGAKGQSSTPDDAFVPLLLLLGVTFVVLISACANIANLLLAKATGRAGEMAVRLSIGAARRHLIGQLLGESLLLAVFGAAFGVVVAQATLAGTAALLPGDAAEFLVFRPDVRMVAFLAIVTVGTGVLFGLFPALHSTRPNLTTALKGQAGQPGGARSAKRFRLVLATTQITLSMALLAIAGLFIKSLVNVSRVELGMRTDNLITFNISPEMNGYNAQRSRQIFEQVEDELIRLPGVTDVTGGLVPLLSNDNWSSNVSVEGFKAGPDTDSNSNVNEVAPAYFKTMGIPLLAGREFTRADVIGAPKVAIVNEAFAKKFGLGLQAVGRRMEIGNAGKLDLEIVGLAKDAKYSDVKKTPPPQLFTPYRQDERVGELVFYARTAGSPDSVIGAIAPMMRRIDPTLPIDELRTMEQQVRENVFQDRFVSTLAAVFAGLATILAAVGLYGVLAYTVAQRTREIGLRMALGADASRIRSMVMRQVALMTLVGGGIGLALAMVAGVYAKSELYEMTGLDPVVLVSSAVLLAMVAFGAGFIPAYRASKVDPMLALRYE
jgi:predicted permease